MIITKTPFRLSFFGGGTDYEEWYSKRGGHFVGSTIDKYCYITLRHMPHFHDFRQKIVYSKTELVNDIASIEHPVVRNTFKHFDYNDGIELSYHGELPAWSGTGSSSSFTVSLTQAMNTLLGIDHSKSDLVDTAIHIEKNLCHENVGVQDQFLAAHGGFNIVEIGESGKLSSEKLSLNPKYLDYISDNMILGYTGIRRKSSDIAKTKIDSIKEGSSIATLSEMMDISKEGASLFQSEASISEIASLMTKNWSLKKQLSSLVSNDFLNDIYEQALVSGALGGKIMGAGSGGFFMFFIPKQKQEAFREGLPSIREWVNFSFESAGSQVISKQ